MGDMLVIWDKKYLTGIAEIDAQHQRLVHIINRLYQGLSDSGVDRASSFHEAAHHAVEYVKTHFAFEEQLMQQHRFPGYERQKKEHVQFIQRLLEDTRKFDEGDRLAPNRFVRYLADWLMSHIAVEDRKIGEYLRDLPPPR